MELSSSDKERIQHQYDALAKKTLVGEAKSHRRTLAKRAAREVPFSDLSESELAATSPQCTNTKAGCEVLPRASLPDNSAAAVSCGEHVRLTADRTSDISQLP